MNQDASQRRLLVNYQGQSEGLQLTDIKVQHVSDQFRDDTSSQIRDEQDRSSVKPFTQDPALIKSFDGPEPGIARSKIEDEDEVLVEQSEPDVDQ